MLKETCALDYRADGGAKANVDVDMHGGATSHAITGQDGGVLAMIEDTRGDGNLWQSLTIPWEISSQTVFMLGVIIHSDSSNSTDDYPTRSRISSRGQRVVLVL